MNEFYVVGPTASGKSELAVEVASRLSAEIVGADAFQVYAGLDRLTAKPGADLRARVPHHLISAVPLREEMSAMRFRELATEAINEIEARGNKVVVVGGSGLYVRALTEGFSPMPATDQRLREKLAQLSLGEMNFWLRRLDPVGAATIDQANSRRVIRALEICLASGQPASELRKRPAINRHAEGNGVFVFYHRDELYQRIDARVEQMFADGVVEEVRTAGALSATAEKTLGVREIRELLAGEITHRECLAAIQQATRRYAKRQLTWFRRQTIFEPLNLSALTIDQSVEWITRKARLYFAHD